MVTFWLVCTAAGIGAAFWWLTQHLPTGLRDQAAFGVLIVAALAFRLGMLAQEIIDHRQAGRRKG